VSESESEVRLENEKERVKKPEPVKFGLSNDTLFFFR
jgi:hypothetical protein